MAITIPPDRLCRINLRDMQSNRQQLQFQSIFLFTRDPAHARPYARITDVRQSGQNALLSPHGAVLGITYTRGTFGR